MLALVLGAALVAPAARAEPVPLASTPAAGTRLARAFELEHRLVLQRLATTHRGAEQLSPAGTSLTGRLGLHVLDEVRAAEAGRPTVFRRAFEGAALRLELGSAADGSGRARTVEASSPIVGASVLYAFAPARGDYGRLYDAREESEEFLGRLGAELELAWLVPGRAVDVGDEWDLDRARLGELFAHGGELPLRFGRDAEPMFVRMLSLGAGGPLHAVFGDPAQGPAQGTARARLTAVEDAPDGRRARIALELDVRVERDQTAQFERELTPTEHVSGIGVRSARVTWSFRGSGEAVWDVAAGRLVSVALSGAESVALVAELEGRDGPQRNTAELSGGLKLRIDVERR